MILREINKTDYTYFDEMYKMIFEIENYIDDLDYL